jgi:hypothetical protein
MPLPGRRWRHITINPRCSWLHGDERGFRDRDHRTHSSGDYNDPPPEDEHDGLRKYFEEQSGDIIVIPSHLRPVIGAAIVRNLTDHGHRLLALAIGGLHGHILTELPDDVGPDQNHHRLGEAEIVRGSDA